MRQSDPAILPIIAGSKIEQLRESIAALDITLSTEHMHRLDTAGNPARQAGMDTTLVTAPDFLKGTAFIAVRDCAQLKSA